jgi:hypothetical protein
MVKKLRNLFFENEYEDDDENDAHEIVNPTRPRPRTR